MISARTCEPWCVDGTGHQNGAVGRSDQVCVSTPTTPFNEYPVVSLYLDVLEDRHGEIDRELNLTSAEARQLAAGLIAAANLIDPTDTSGATE